MCAVAPSSPARAARFARQTRPDSRAPYPPRAESIRAPCAPVVGMERSAPLCPCPSTPYRARVRRVRRAARRRISAPNHSAEERAESNRPCEKSGFAV